MASDFAELSVLVRARGLLDRRPGYYVAKTALTLGLFAAGWVLFVLVGNSWWQLLTAAYLAFAFGQVAFLGHDAGHRQIFRTKRPHELLGLVLADLLVGVSYGWWVGKHNRHHSHPNHVGLDPDITIGAVAFTTDQAQARRGLARVAAKHQAVLFFPMLVFEAAHLHVASVRGVLHGASRYRRLELVLLVAHVVAYVGALLIVLSPLRALVFLIVQQGLFGLYLGCAFAPNHKGMPVLDGEEERDFLRRQVLTSRNVRGGPAVDFLLGGLNYQIEHHLFPSMPRPNLRHSQALIRSFCDEHAIAYCESSLFGSYAEALGHLHSVGAPLRGWVVE